MSRRFGIHCCHPWSGDCAMRGLRINLRTPWAFVIVGLAGGAVQKRGRDGRYGDEWTWLSIERSSEADRRATRGR